MVRTDKMMKNDKAAAAALTCFCSLGFNATLDLSNSSNGKWKKAIISLIKRPRAILRPEMDSLFLTATALRELPKIWLSPSQKGSNKAGKK